MCLDCAGALPALEMEFFGAKSSDSCWCAETAAGGSGGWRLGVRGSSVKLTSFLKLKQKL